MITMEDLLTRKIASKKITEYIKSTLNALEIAMQKNDMKEFEDVWFDTFIEPEAFDVFQDNLDEWDVERWHDIYRWYTKESTGIDIGKPRKPTLADMNRLLAVLDNPKKFKEVYEEITKPIFN